MAKTSLAAGVASGDWLDRRRLRIALVLLLIGMIVTLSRLVLTADGTLDRLGRPLGSDFSAIYAAGWMANHGLAVEAWEWPAIHQVQQQLQRNPDLPFFGWFYPPPFLLIASLLACLPYLPALVAWQASTLALVYHVARQILPERGLWLAVLAAPTTLICLGHGQNAFMTASLLGGGLLLLDRRPWLAGALLGCLLYKPQFAVLLPFVLLASGNWRAFAGAALSACAIIAVTLAVWGWPVWAAFIASLEPTRTILIEQGATGWGKVITIFATLRGLGASLIAAYGAQAVLNLIAVLAAAAAARWASSAVRNAVVCCGVLLSTPYAYDYDMVMLDAAILFLIADVRERGWLPWEKSLLGLAFVVPLFGRSVTLATMIPVNLLAVVAVFMLALRRGWQLDLQQRFRWPRTAQPAS